MDLGLKGKIALVCAASRGLGRAVAYSLAAEGCRVAICGRDEAALKKTAEELAQATGATVVPIVADVTKIPDVDRLLAEVRRQLGEIDILVHNVGGPPAGGLMAVNDDQWRAGIDSMLMSLIHMVRDVVPGMKERRWGRVVAIASSTIQQPKEDLLISSTVRAGVAAFLKAIAAGLSKDNVLVHTVCPGPTRTNRMVDLAGTIARNKGITPEEAEAGLTADVPMGRMGNPEEVGDFITCLVSDRLTFTTGLTVAVDGGQVKALI